MCSYIAQGTKTGKAIANIILSQLNSLGKGSNFKVCSFESHVLYTNARTFID